MKAKTGIDMCGNEISNAVIENRTTAPENPKTGQFYYNTTHKHLYIYNGSEWEIFNPTQAYADSRAYTDSQISKLMGGTPTEALDTLLELAEAIEDNQDLIASLQALVSAGVHKKKVFCPALTPSSGVCTWVCAHGLTMESSDLICKVYTSSGEEVICDVTINSAANVIIKIASDTAIASSSYYAVFIG